MKKLIGRGAFTKCYLISETKVLLESVCPIKEAMAFGWFPESTLFPEVGKIEQFKYEMGYYPKVSSLKQNLDEDQYNIYKTLRKLASNLPSVRNIHDSYSKLYKAFDGLTDETLSTTMCEALDACSNYGSDIGFEISPRNVAVKDGKLILMDVFYSKSKLSEFRGVNR